MALDGIVINALAFELNQKLEGGRVDKIHQPEHSEIIMHIRSKGENHKLLICANPSLARIHTTVTSKENPQTPPMFCMLLRKHLSGGKILRVYQEQFERIVKIDIEAYDEMGFLSVKTLVVEIMGKHSNIILVGNDSRIIDSINHVDITVSSVRQVLPGLIYENPPDQGKKNPLTADLDEISSIIKDADEPISRQIMTGFMGISPLIANEIAYRATGDCDTLGADVPPAVRERCAQCMVNIFEKIKNNDYFPAIYTDNITKKPADFNAVEISQYSGIAKAEFFESMNSAVEAYYTQKATRENIKQKTGDLLKIVNSNLDRCRKKLQLQLEILEKCKGRDKYKTYGDLITSYIYMIKQGMKEVTVSNFYDEACPDVKIPLMWDLTPSENAQRYYKRYNKDKTAEFETQKQKKLNEEEIDYLESVQDSILKADNSREIAEIREELTEQGYLRFRGKHNKKAVKKVFEPMHFVSSDGYDIYVGKNNKQNDYLTLKMARSTDIWFHTKNIHGSHTIIKTSDAMTVPDKTYEEAACLAAYYSRGKASQSVPVDYTEVKNVKKPAGAKPGMVIYVNYNTMYVTPSEEMVEKLKK